MIMSGLGRGNPRPEEVRAPARRCYSCGFGVDQQTVHVEKNGFDGFLQHVFVLSSVPERPITNTGGRIFMRIHNLYVDDKGETHFRDVQVEWKHEGRGGKTSDMLPATGIIFRET